MFSICRSLPTDWMASGDSGCSSDVSAGGLDVTDRQRCTATLYVQSACHMTCTNYLYGQCTPH